MKKIIALMMLVAGIKANVIAQEEIAAAKTSQVFELQAGSIKRRFTIELGKGNKMLVELAEEKDLDYLTNIDSLLHIFLQDTKPFKDSLSDELTIKRIDYLFDSAGRNKLRLQSFSSKGSSFVVGNGDVAALKLDQDTINMLGPVRYIGGYRGKMPFYVTRFYRIRFLLNQATDLSSYADGVLNGKIHTLQETQNKNWVRTGRRWKIKGGDESISANQPNGYVGEPGDMLALTANVNLQNYKNYFAPSFSVQAKFIFPRKVITYELGFAWEPYFLFAKNSQGNLQTYRNDFVVLDLGMKPSIGTAGRINEFHFTLLNHLSIGYLFPRRSDGDFFDRHTFRIGTGGVELKGDKIKLEPVFYFHDFFKGATPGVRLSVNF